jgi:hypothetical protein
MTAKNQADQGRREAGTLPNSQELAAAMADLGENSDADQPGLFFDPVDSLAQKADKANAARKGAGRPPGSANRRNSDLFDLAMARGYKHPFIRLMEIVSADPDDLLSTVPEHWPASDKLITKVIEAMLNTRLEALKLQIRAAEALLPYDMAKKPQQIEVKGKSLHVFVAGKLSDIKAGGVAGFSLTGDSEENQGVSVVEVEPVGRQPVGRTDNGEQDQ